MGAGSWGTTFAQVLCDAGTPAVLCSRRPELASAITATGENRDYLPGITLTDALRATADPAEALAGADLVVLAVPAQSLRENLARWAPLLPAGALLVSLIKGIELGSCDRMSQVIAQVAGLPASQIAVIMADITRLLGELRGEQPPAEPYNPAIARRKARQELQALAKAQASQEQAAGDDGQQAGITDSPDDSRPAGASPP